VDSRSAGDGVAVSGVRHSVRVQDRYAGDVGDFLKLGLLRWLTAADDDGRTLDLGVVWYRVVDEGHNLDGKHVAYLDPRSPGGLRLRPLDPDLYDRLAAMVQAGERSVDALERSGALPPLSRCFARALDFADLPVAERRDRTERRRDWLSAALDATAGADLVFFDPDNGIRRSTHSVPSHRTKSVKHTYLDELRPYLARGQSVVIYHHADRSAPVAAQAQHRMADLVDELGIEPLGAVRASRGTTRLFLLVASPTHVDRLRHRVSDLASSVWRNELAVIWPQGTTVD
jgi:hypothetical protein